MKPLILLFSGLACAPCWSAPSGHLDEGTLIISGVDMPIKAAPKTPLVSPPKPQTAIHTPQPETIVKHSDVSAEEELLADILDENLGVKPITHSIR
ncbi:hypothetical protein, partial [uncultured Vibrio sp.]|uniref:hypothetical protein n=1 Tax=uncultured Vibrio sp. TaxID=114054 RepID=UPI002635FBBB